MNRLIPRRVPLRTVAVTARVQRLSLAAAELHCAERTIRCHVTRLEQELGRRLFYRIRGANGGMRPTEALRELLVNE